MSNYQYDVPSSVPSLDKWESGDFLATQLDSGDVFATQGEVTPDAANSGSFEEWHRMLKETSAPGPSKKRARSPDAGSDVATPEPTTPKRTRTVKSTPGLPSPRRPIAVLMETRWSDMTDEEKARLLLPMMQGHHPIDYEADEHGHDASYGAIRQREALQKAQGLTNLASAETTPPAQASSPEVFQQDTLDAIKKMEEKRDKKAAYMRKKRASEKRQKEEEEMRANWVAAQEARVAQQKRQQQQQQQQQALLDQQREQVLLAQQQQEEGGGNLFAPGDFGFLGYKV